MRTKPRKSLFFVSVQSRVDRLAVHEIFGVRLFQLFCSFHFWVFLTRIPNHTRTSACSWSSFSRALRCSTKPTQMAPLHWEENWTCEHFTCWWYDSCNTKRRGTVVSVTLTSARPSLTQTVKKYPQTKQRWKIRKHSVDHESTTQMCKTTTLHGWKRKGNSSSIQVLDLCTFSWIINSDFACLDETVEFLSVSSENTHKLDCRHCLS